MDEQIWKKINELYVQDWEDERQKNQLEAYWCRPDEEKQDLFQNPSERIFARFLRSYLNTTWHKIKKDVKPFIESWFDPRATDIIRNVEKDLSALPGELQDFCKNSLRIVHQLQSQLKNYDFNEVQTHNFKKLVDVINAEFTETLSPKKQKELPKSQKVSEYEKIIYEALDKDKPYKTIMKMQKLLPGLGIALTCDFLKESHLCNIAKPDVHICHVFSVIDRIPYSMDLALVKRVVEFADNVCPPVEDHFCESGAYHVDKIIWMICSKGKKEELLKALDKMTP